MFYRAIVIRVFEERIQYENLRTGGWKNAELALAHCLREGLSGKVVDGDGRIVWAFCKHPYDPAEVFEMSKLKEVARTGVGRKTTYFYKPL